jgi:hypothetical protein
VIALLLQLVCTLAVLLYILAILVPGDPGRSLRAWAVGLFFGTIVFSIVMSVLWVEMHDWRAWVVWIVLSPIAYLILRTRRGSEPSRPAGQAKRRPSDQQQPPPPPWENTTW